MLLAANPKPTKSTKTAIDLRLDCVFIGRLSTSKSYPYFLVVGNDNSFDH